jgi:hypothetical protein
MAAYDLYISQIYRIVIPDNDSKPNVVYPDESRCLVDDERLHDAVAHDAHGAAARIRMHHDHFLERAETDHLKDGQGGQKQEL